MTKEQAQALAQALKTSLITKMQGSFQVMFDALTAEIDRSAVALLNELTKDCELKSVPKMDKVEKKELKAVK